MDKTLELMIEQDLTQLKTHSDTSTWGEDEHIEERMKTYIKIAGTLYEIACINPGTQRKHIMEGLRQILKGHKLPNRKLHLEVIEQYFDQLCFQKIRGEPVEVHNGDNNYRLTSDSILNTRQRFTNLLQSVEKNLGKSESE